MKIIGYADRLSAFAGETVQVMASTAEREFRADLIRFEKPFRVAKPEADKLVEASGSGVYPGREQAIPVGSYLNAGAAALDLTRGLTIQCWIRPFIPGGRPSQGVIASWDPVREAGFWLGLTSDGRVAFRIGDGRSGVATVHTPTALVKDHWYFVAAVWDAAHGELRLRCDAVPRSWLAGMPSQTVATVETPADGNAGPLLLGASFLAAIDGDRVAPRECFNGKIDRPRLWSKPLSGTDLDALAGGGDPLALTDRLEAAWDFSHDMAGVVVPDQSPRARHGTLINTPMRAVPGANWDGSDVSPHQVREMFASIAFHEDDLADCQWSPDLAIQIPVGTPSGLYGVRLAAGDGFDYVPVYVRRPAGDPTGRVLYLAPTNTYLAYGNEKCFQASPLDSEFVVKSTDLTPQLSDRDHYLDAHPELGASVYDMHPGGRGICYSSRLRPVLTMRPEFTNWLHGFHRHFPADLYLVQWLDHIGVPWDVATDEDLHLDGQDLLDSYRVVVTGSHPEYWTAEMLDALESYLAGGGKLMYLGGNGFYWVTGINADRPYQVEVRRGFNGTRSWTSEAGEAYLSTTGEPGGLWRYRGRSPNRLVGIGFASEGWGGAPGYQQLPNARDPETAFIFEGIAPGETIGEFGLVMGGAAGDEVDRFDPEFGTPPETRRLATSEGRHTDYYQLVIEDLTCTFPGRGGTEEPRVRADITYLAGEGGGAVFSTGSINWIGSLMHNDGVNNVSRMTENVLRAFAGE